MAVIKHSVWLLLASPLLLAATPPADRADAMYHAYDGGGVEVTGPSLLVRKGDGKHFSVSANYYVDTISSASIDVLTQGSPYSEERTQTSVSADWLTGDSTLSLGYTNSDESDYNANTVSFGISQTFFGDLTTLSLGYNLGQDEVMRNGQDDFSEQVDRQQYRLGLTQIVTRNTLLALDFENITEEGFLNNPYRSARYRDAGSAVGYSFEPEVYPNTRTSNALALRFKYHLPWRAAIGGGYRWSEDDWDIQSNTLHAEYTQPWGEHWLFSLHARQYSQSQADFYSDLFARAGEQNFMARDKELSEFSNYSLGFGISWEQALASDSLLNKWSVTMRYDHYWFEYDNYRDLTIDAPVGEEPLYEFGADVWQLYVSAWY